MGFREQLASRPRLVGVLATLMFLLSLIALFLRAQPTSTAARRPNLERSYYFDLQRGELFPSSTQDPPIPAPSGGAGVLAHVYACGNCDQESDRFIGYLTTFASRPVPGSPQGDRIALAKPPYKWLPISTPEADAIRQSVQQRCEQPQECHP